MTKELFFTEKKTANIKIAVFFILASSFGGSGKMKRKRNFDDRG